MKILHVTTISNTAKFLIPHIKMLIELGHTVDVAFNIRQEIDPEIVKMGCKVHTIDFQRSPLHKDNIKAYVTLKKIITINNYELIHTHTPVASAITRLVCKNMGNIKIIYTAHGFHFYKGAPLKNWILYYPIEKYLAKYTDVLITMNKEDYELAKNKFKAKKIEFVPGVGIDVEKIIDIKVDRILKRKELGLSENDFVILSIGELNKNKNHETVIKSISKLETENIKYIICGQGPLDHYLRNLICKLNLRDKVQLLGFRRDVIEILKISDLLIFPSFREGLPVSVMEAMASGLPCIGTKIRGNQDLISEGKGGLFIDKPIDVENFVRAIQKLEKDENLRRIQGEYNFSNIKKYDIKNINNILDSIYKDIEN